MEHHCWIVISNKVSTFVGPAGSAVISIFATNANKDKTKYVGENRSDGAQGQLWTHVPLRLNLKVPLEALFVRTFTV